jgi:hypothetical protein
MYVYIYIYIYIHIYILVCPVVDTTLKPNLTLVFICGTGIKRILLHPIF